MKHRREVRRYAAAFVVVAAFAVTPASAHIGGDVTHLPNRVRPLTYNGTVHVASLPHDTARADAVEDSPQMHVPRMQVPHDAPSAPRFDDFSMHAAAASAGEGEQGAPLIDASFASVADNGFKPPDVAGGVSASHLVTTVNGSFRVQSRAGATLTDVTLASFWSGVAGSPFDPRVVYDPGSARWVHIAVSDARSASSKMLIAASASSDPTGTWRRYSIVADPSGVNWADYPTVGLNAGQVVLQTNMYRVNGDAFATSLVEVFAKAALLSGASLSAIETNLAGYGSTHQPSVAYGSSGPIALLQDLNGNSGGSGYLRLFTVDIATSAVSVGPLVATSQTWASSGNNRNDFAPQMGSSALVQTNDSRMGNVVWRNGKLFAAQTVFLPASAPTHSAIQWWIIDAASGAVLQRGLVDDPTGAVFAAFPSVGVNASEDVLIGHARFSSNEYPSAGYAFRYGTDAPHTMRTGGLLKAGQAPYYKPSGSSPSRNRWGDYTATIVDPADDNALWTIQEYATTPSGGVDRWATWWGRLIPNPGPASTVSPASIGFGAVNVGVPSTTRLVTLTNAGSVPLAAGTTAVTGPHAVEFRTSSDSCSGASLAPGGSCSVGVVFTPSGQGARAATLSLPSNSATSPDTVSLTGTGYVEPPRMSIEPGSLSFGGVAVGATSPPMAVAIRNVGSQTFSILGTRIIGLSDFTVSGNCNGALAPGSSCSVSVSFRPAALGSRTASLEVESSLGRPLVQLSGSGLDVVAPVSDITTADGSLALGSLLPLRGTATDEGSGVDRVTVVYQPLFGSAETAVAALVCNGGRSSCTWTVSAPIMPGIYIARGTARDLAGNLETNGPSITIYVP